MLKLYLFLLVLRLAKAGHYDDVFFSIVQHETPHFLFHFPFYPDKAL